MLQISQKILRNVANGIAKRTKIDPEVVMLILTVGIPLIYRAYKSRKETVAKEKRDAPIEIDSEK